MALLQRVAEKSQWEGMLCSPNRGRDARFSENSGMPYRTVAYLAHVLIFHQSARRFLAVYVGRKMEQVGCHSHRRSSVIPDLLSFCTSAVELHGKRVFVAGLDKRFPTKAEFVRF